MSKEQELEKQGIEELKTTIERKNGRIEQIVIEPADWKVKFNPFNIGDTSIIQGKHLSKLKDILRKLR